MLAAKDYILKNRLAIFDWSVLTISFLLGFIFPTITDFINDKGFYHWMLAALLFYICGAALKDLPLSYRLSHSAKTIKPISYVLFLVIGHWLIMLMVFILSETQLRNIFHLPVAANNETSFQSIIIAISVSSFITWLVYRGKSKRKHSRIFSDDYLFRRELLADFFLIIGVAILSFVFWEKGAMAMLANAKTQTIGDIWFLFLFLSFLFLFFYLPLRYLFFMEGANKVSNRNRLFLIFGFMLLKALFEMLNI